VRFKDFYPQILLKSLNFIHSLLPACEDALVILDVARDRTDAVIRFSGGLFDGFAFNNVFMTYDAFVSKSRSHIMNGPSPWNNIIVSAFIIPHIFSNGCRA